MTLIQPNKSNPLLNKILGALITLSVICSVWLVFEYTKIVDLNHSISQMSADMKDMAVQSSEMRQNIFTMFDSNNMAKFASERQLVQERAPRYIDLSAQWPSVTAYQH